MKKQNDYSWVGWVAVAIVLLYGGNQGWFHLGSVINNYPPNNAPPNTPLPDKVTEYLTYTATLNLNPNNICSGDATTGTINTNIPNGVASIFVNTGAGYTLFLNVNLDGNGDFTRTERITALGTATFIAVCCDANRNCKLSNTDVLVVRTCDTDGDGIPDETDPDDDNDGYPDEQEIDEGTDPKDKNSHPTEESPDCNSICVGLGYVSAFPSSPVSSPGYCDAPTISKYIASIDSYCCCMPSSQSSYTCGQGSDAQCHGTCPSNFPYCLQVSVSESEYSCMCVDNDGETGNVAPDWKTGGSMYNHHPFGGGGTTLIDNDDSLNTFPNDLKIKSTCVDSLGTHEDRCVDGMVEEWYVVILMNYCSKTQHNCAGEFGANSYCRSGACFVDPYVHPSNCASTCGSFDWSYQIDNAEHCLDANVNLCYYSGQMTGVHSYHAENNCCCFTCG